MLSEEITFDGVKNGAERLSNSSDPFCNPAEMLGVDDYVRKPFPMDELIPSVKRLVGE